MKFIVLGLIFGLANAQFPAATEKWTGPFADHVPGQLVQDTPEVAAAKVQHFKAFSDYLAILPELPPEQRYQPTPTLQQPMAQNTLANNYNYQPQPAQQQAFSSPHFQAGFAQQNAFPMQPQTVPQPTFVPQPFPQLSVKQQNPAKFAEEVPRSPTGEAPEVYAARLAHFEIHKKILANLGH